MSLALNADLGSPAKVFIHHLPVTWHATTGETPERYYLSGPLALPEAYARATQDDDDGTSQAIYLSVFSSVE